MHPINEKALFTSLSIGTKHLSIQQELKRLTASTSKIYSKTNKKLTRAKGSNSSTMRKMSKTSLNISLECNKHPCPPRRRLKGHLVNLPSEVLRLIFSFLPVQSMVKSDRVCKTWHRVLNDDTLWYPVVERIKDPILLPAIRGHLKTKRPLNAIKQAMRDIDASTTQELEEAKNKLRLMTERLSRKHIQTANLAPVNENVIVSPNSNTSEMENGALNQKVAEVSNAQSEVSNMQMELKVELKRVNDFLQSLSKQWGNAQERVVNRRILEQFERRCVSSVLHNQTSIPLILRRSATNLFDLNLLLFQFYPQEYANVQTSSTPYASIYRWQTIKKQVPLDQSYYKLRDKIISEKGVILSTEHQALLHRITYLSKLPVSTWLENITTL